MAGWRMQLLLSGLVGPLLWFGGDGVEAVT